MEEMVKRGYLNEDFRLFHIRDRIELELNYHYHEFDKIVVFLSGKVTYVVESKAYFLNPWDILLVPHGQIHRPIIDTSKHYERITLWIKPDYLRKNGMGEDLRQCFDIAEEKRFALIRPDNGARVTLMRLLSAVEGAMKSREFGSELMYHTCFLQFLVELNRIALADATDKDTAAFRSDPKLDEIVAYINGNLNEDLSIDAIAKKFFISKSYLMHKFKETTGCSAHRYIQQKRLMLAAELIRDGMSVAEAGARCGYGDYSAFLRAFKKLFGATPRDVG